MRALVMIGIAVGVALAAPTARAQRLVRPAACADGKTAPPPPAPQKEAPKPPPPNYDRVIYRDFEGTPFVNGAHPNDIGQGNIGNCFFMSTLAAVADKHPEILTEGLTTMRGDRYRMRFFHPGRREWTWITLQGRSFPVYPDGFPLFAREGAEVSKKGNELWPMFYEKAFANLVAGRGTGVNGYNTIGHGGGGPDFDPLEAMTGQPSRHFDPDAIKKMTFDEMAALTKNDVVIAGTYGDLTMPLIKDKTLVEEHMYWVQGVDPKTKSVLVRNPHNWNDGTPIAVPFADFQKHFDLVSANRVDMNAIPVAPGVRRRPPPKK